MPLPLRIFFLLSLSPETHLGGLGSPCSCLLGYMRSSGDLRLCHQSPLGPCQAEIGQPSDWTIWDPQHPVCCILPSQECHSLYRLPGVALSLQTPTGTQESYSYSEALINIHHGYPHGCPLYSQMCLDFCEYQQSKVDSKLAVSEQGGHRAQCGAPSSGNEGTSGMFWLWSHSQVSATKELVRKSNSIKHLCLVILRNYFRYLITQIQFTRLHHSCFNEEITSWPGQDFS